MTLKKCRALCGAWIFIFWLQAGTQRRKTFCVGLDVGTNKKTEV